MDGLEGNGPWADPHTDNRVRLREEGWICTECQGNAKGKRRQGAGEMKCTLYLPGYSRLVLYTLGADPGGGAEEAPEARGLGL